MKMIFTRCLTMILTLMYVCCYAQPVSKKGTILKGSVTDETKAPVPFCMVILYTANDSALYKGEACDENGIFQISDVVPGKYYLVASMVGMGRAIKQDIILNEQNALCDLGDIVLAQPANMLSMVTVTADKPFIEKQVDKTVVNIENSIIQNSAPATDMLGKLPGVMIDRDGNVTLNGRRGVVILIDGKPTGLSGQNLYNYLKGLNTNAIQKVEIITNPSAKYDAAGNAGVINIVMKKNRRQGLNGTLTSNYSQGRYTNFGQGFGLAYKDRWYNIYANYTYDYRHTFTNLVLNRMFYQQGILNGVYKTDSYITDLANTHAPRLGADFNLSSKTSLSVLANGQFMQDNASAYDKTDNLDKQLMPVYHSIFENSNKFSHYNYSINGELRHQFDSLGQELKINLDYAHYYTGIDQQFATQYILPDATIVPGDRLNGNHHDKLFLYAVKGDYSKPLNQKATLDAGFKCSYITLSNNMRFFNPAYGTDYLDTLRSSLFDYNENINAAYLNLNKTWSKLTLQGGLRLEQTQASGYQKLSQEQFKRNYIQVFPTLYAEYKFNDKHVVNLNGGRRIDRPAYDQMNPYRKLINPTTYMQGNPLLLPQLGYNADLSYAYNNQWFLTLGASITKNNITEVLVQDAVTKTTHQTVINLDRFHYYSASVAYAKKITDWWTTNTSILGYYGIYRGAVNGTSLNKHMPSFYINTGNSFSLCEGLSLELGFNYSYKVFYGVTTIQPMNNLSFGIQKSVLKNNGTVTLNVSDIFWRSYARGATEFGSVSESWSAKRDTRLVNISFSYKFGKSQSTLINRATGSDDEKKRIR
ncbi:MAG: TonB-dependent receptor [Bacteroidetes bacterium]|nr:TonB-dependent receptor [Bacteroidota bacterium]